MYRRVSIVDDDGKPDYVYADDLDLQTVAHLRRCGVTEYANGDGRVYYDAADVAAWCGGEVRP